MKKEKRTTAYKLFGLFGGNTEEGANPEPEHKERPKHTEKGLKEVVKYTEKYPGYDLVDRETPDVAEIGKSSRYHLGKDGYYHPSNPGNQGSAVLMFTGDLMCRAGQQTAALERYGEYVFDESYSMVKDVFSKADLVTGNLETTLCARAPYMSELGRADGNPHDNAPPSYLRAVKYAGFDLVAMANNHACDSGVYGILDTLDNVESYNFMHTGTFPKKGVQRFILVEVNGIKVAVMSYATHFNRKDKLMTEEGRKILLNKYSKERLARHVRQARELGAEFIVAYNHWGKEFTHDITEKQETRAKDMADAGVDYIIGSHPHSLQKYDIITAEDGRRVPVFYSLGNFLSNMPKEITKDTGIVKLVLSRDEDGKVKIADEGFIPCYIYESFDGKDFVTVPLFAENSNDENKDFFEESFERIKEIMGDRITCIDSMERV